MLNTRELLCPPGIDSWIDLSRVDPDAEVQGEVCLDVQILEGARGRCLRCHVLQARYGHDRGRCGTALSMSEALLEISPSCLGFEDRLTQGWGGRTSGLTTRIPWGQTVPGLPGLQIAGVRAHAKSWLGPQ